MSAASKRAWRTNNPERRRAAERERAYRRRHGGAVQTPFGPFRMPGPETESYWRYERSTKRYLNRLRRRIVTTQARLDAQLAAYPWLAQVDEWLAEKLDAR
jgi:hypothetical protein